MKVVTCSIINLQPPNQEHHTSHEESLPYRLTLLAGSLQNAVPIHQSKQHLYSRKDASHIEIN